MKAWIELFTDEDGKVRARVEVDGRHPRFRQRYATYGPDFDAAGVLSLIAEDIDATTPHPAEDRVA